jgi:hypothetical protein
MPLGAVVVVPPLNENPVIGLSYFSLNSDVHMIVKKRCSS